MANEKRLIDANALDSVLEDFESRHTKSCFVITAKAISKVRQIVYAMRTVDAVEVVHGRWKYYHKQNKAVCTNCSFERDLDVNFGKAVSCPNCGAKMDGDGNA